MESETQSRERLQLEKELAVASGTLKYCERVLAFKYDYEILAQKVYTMKRIGELNRELLSN